MKNLAIIPIIGLLVIGGAILLIQLVSFSNNEIELRNKFDATLLARTSFYNSMAVTIQQQTQISRKVDDSFKDNINAIMTNRKDSEQIMWKWVQETNPNANFGEVTKLYEKLMATIEAKRNEFTTRETTLADIQREHKSLIMKFPNSIYNMIFKRLPLEFEIIQTEQTKQIMETGIEPEQTLDL